MRLNAPFDRISVEPVKMGGSPAFAKLLQYYPDLEPEDLRQALQFAASSLDGSIDSHIHAA